jgi:dihydropteroate synthase
MKSLAITGAMCARTGAFLANVSYRRVHYDDLVGGIAPSVSRIRAQNTRMKRGVPEDKGPYRPNSRFGKEHFHSFNGASCLRPSCVGGVAVLMALSVSDFVGETVGRPVDQRLLEPWRQPFCSGPGCVRACVHRSGLKT